MDSINSRIAEELGVRPQQVEAAVALLDEGSTVPFIARYRKEVTGSLDDIQLRHLEERLRYLRELDERRISILASIEEQKGKYKLNVKLTLKGVLTDEQRDELHRVADRCPVHKLMTTAEVTIETRLSEGAFSQ